MQYGRGGDGDGNCGSSVVMMVMVVASVTEAVGREKELKVRSH